MSEYKIQIYLCFILIPNLLLLRWGHSNHSHSLGHRCKVAALNTNVTVAPYVKKRGKTQYVHFIDDGVLQHMALVIKELA